jgi:hypothetical protein
MSLLPLHPAGGQTAVEVDEACVPEHCFHAFDALYCALTDSTPIPPSFPDEKLWVVVQHPLDRISDVYVVARFSLHGIRGLLAPDVRPD